MSYGCPAKLSACPIPTPNSTREFGPVENDGTIRNSLIFIPMQLTLVSGPLGFQTMPVTDNPSPPKVVPTPEPGWLQARRQSFFTPRAADVLWYRQCDDLSGTLILPMLVFSPWAFGTTQPWSIWTMNIVGYLLGLLLLLKVFIRRVRHYPAPRWENFSTRTGALTRHRDPAVRMLTRTLAWLTLAVLAWCLTSAWNSAANYDPETRQFDYQSYISWLPHSLDGHSSWNYLCIYLGLAASFWSVVDWLAGMTAHEERILPGMARSGSDKTTPQFPARLRTLLWLLCLNGLALGVEAIVQRASGSNKLLFLVQPRVHIDGESQFGSYAYRSNAAQYFNLLWPLALGFWLTLQQRAAEVRSRAHHWLLLAAAVMAACPIISTSRGGALVSVGLLGLAMLYLLLAAFLARPRTAKKRSRHRRNKPLLPPETTAAPAAPLAAATSVRQAAPRPAAAKANTTGWLLLFLTITLSMGWYFGWDLLAPRMDQIGAGYDAREDMYKAAEPMTKDYPLFGTGPGTFGTVFQLYRFSDEVYWPGQLHNDWLETQITFGWLGLGLICSALAVVGLRGLAPGGVLRGSQRLEVFIWLGLIGSMIFALFDFPFQIHSVLLLFLVMCALLFNLGRR